VNVRKFYASSTRDALRQVRDILGADAIILSNRQVVGGIEIMAVADQDLAASVAPATVAPNAAPAASVPADTTPAIPSQVESAARPVMSENTVSPQAMMDIIREIKCLRGMVEGQLSGFAWGDLHRREPFKADMLRVLLAVGLSPALSRQLLGRLPPKFDYNKGMRWIKAALVHNLRVVKPEDDLIEKGGVFALVGPTGVGKTTTVAKLAARCTLKHGAASVVMMTTDSYRIGAHEQLRIYGNILGVPVYAVKNESDLLLTLADLRHKHLVLIDTVGMNQRDRRVADQVALLCGHGGRVKRLLLLSAISQGDALDDVVRAYNNATAPVDGCILTKADEAVSTGSILDVIIRHRLMLYYVTNGQRVPEDMHLANAHYLIDRSFKAARDASPFTLNESEYPLTMGSARGDIAVTTPSRGGVA